MRPTDIPGALSETECDVLADVARGAFTHALEVGHLHGRSTAVLLQSLPTSCALTTLDHHRGDQWSGPVDAAVVYATVDPLVDISRPFRFVDADMLDYPYVGPYDFVFYDADHSLDGVSSWWARVRDHLAPSCVLVFDDADWAEQSVLTGLAVLDGFAVVTDREWFRGERDKNDPATFTLQVMARAHA